MSKLCISLKNKKIKTDKSSLLPSALSIVIDLHFLFLKTIYAVFYNITFDFCLIHIFLVDYWQQQLLLSQINLDLTVESRGRCFGQVDDIIKVLSLD